MWGCGVEGSAHPSAQQRPHFTLSVADLGFGVWGRGRGFKVQGSGFRAQGSGFRVSGFGSRVQGSGFTNEVLHGTKSIGPHRGCTWTGDSIEIPLDYS